MEEVPLINIFGIKILRHDCIDKKMYGKPCRFYFAWSHAHYFTFFGIRIVIGTARADTEQEKLEKLR